MSLREPSAARELDPHELVLLANSAMRARRRPKAIAALWAWEAAVALVMAWPVAATVGAFYGRHPQGDAPLWAQGSLALMDLGLRAQAARPALVVEAGIVLSLYLAVGLLPSAAMVTSVAYTTRDLQPPSLRQAMARAIEVFGPTALVFVAATAVELLLVGIGAVVGDWVNDALYDRAGEAHAEQIGWAVTGLFVIAAGLVGILQEVTRAGIVRFRVGAQRGIELGVHTLRRAPLRITWSWTWRALASLAPIAFGSLVAERLGGRGGFSLLVLVVMHQAVILARVALRASWLARAVRAADAEHSAIHE